MIRNADEEQAGQRLDSLSTAIAGTLSADSPLTGWLPLETVGLAHLSGSIAIGLSCRSQGAPGMTLPFGAIELHQE